MNDTKQTVTVTLPAYVAKAIKGLKPHKHRPLVVGKDGDKNRAVVFGPNEDVYIVGWYSDDDMPTALIPWDRVGLALIGEPVDATLETDLSFQECCPVWYMNRTSDNFYHGAVGLELAPLALQAEVADRDASRFALYSLAVFVSDDSTTVVATDGHMLNAMRYAGSELAANGKPTFLIPANLVTLAKRLRGKLGGKLTVCYDKWYLDKRPDDTPDTATIVIGDFAAETITITYRQPMNPFPKVSSFIIPKPMVVEYLANNRVILPSESSVERFAKLWRASGKPSDNVGIDLDPNGVTLDYRFIQSIYDLVTLYRKSVDFVNLFAFRLSDNRDSPVHVVYEPMGIQWAIMPLSKGGK